MNKVKICIFFQYLSSSFPACWTVPAIQPLKCRKYQDWTLSLKIQRTKHVKAESFPALRPVIALPGDGHVTEKKTVQMDQMSLIVFVVRGHAVQTSGAVMDTVSVFLCPGCVITTQTVRVDQTRLSVPGLAWRRSSPVQVDFVYSQAGNVMGKMTVGMGVMRRDAGH